MSRWVTKMAGAVCCFALAGGVVSGCSAESDGASDPAPDAVGDVQTDQPVQDDLADPEPVDEEPEAGTVVSSEEACIFSPDEVNAAYSDYSGFVAKGGFADYVYGDDQGYCSYGHSSSSPDWTDISPVAVGVEANPAYYRGDPAVLWDRFCGAGAEPGAICKETPEARIVVEDNFRAFAIRDDVIWEITASGINSGSDADEMGRLLSLARLGGQRSPR